MQNKKVTVLIILSIFAVISLIHGITARPKTRAAQQNIAAGKKLMAPQGGFSVERRATRSKFTSWKRSPFVPSGTPASPNLVLSGIIWNNIKPKAMINDMILTKGDSVGENRIIDIKPDRVILNDGTKNFELKMGK
jgi:type II secretory pathway component PulC